MDAGQLHERCVEEFLHRLRWVRDDQWSRPTPCRGWTVRDLVNHMVNEELWTVPLMAGQRIADVGDRFDGDVLGADPVGSAERAAGQARAAALEQVRADRIVHLSFGDVPASEYAMQLSADHLVHGWDLAAATGSAQRLPSELVEALAGWFSERETQYRQSGAIDERPAADERGDPQRRLLIAFGRDPDWAPPAAGTVDTVDTVHAFNAAFNAADVDSIMALMTDDCVFEATGPAPDGRRHAGAAAVRAVWEQLFTATTQPHFRWEEVFGSGDRAVVRWTFEWVGADGSPGHVRGVDVLTLRGGKVAEKLSYVKG